MLNSVAMCQFFTLAISIRVSRANLNDYPRKRYLDSPRVPVSHPRPPRYLVLDLGGQFKGIS
jgi:hypothetical protein